MEVTKILALSKMYFEIINLEQEHLSLSMNNLISLVVFRCHSSFLIYIIDHPILPLP